MLISTFFTDSHRKMAERHVIHKYRAAGFDDCLCRAEKQRCPSGSFKQYGWNDCTSRKFKWLGNMDADGEPMLFVDADVAIFPGLAEWCEDHLCGMPDNAIAFGDDKVQKCTGVMLFRRTKPVLKWFRFCYEFCDIMGQNDQDGMAVILQIHSQLTGRRLPVELLTLPDDVICNWASLGNDKPWEGDQEIDPPDSMLAWHANWCIGVEKKAEMLEAVTAQRVTGL